MSQTHFADSGRLLARLAHAIQRGEKITFLFGSALTAPNLAVGQRGVPDATSMVEHVISAFSGTEESRTLADLLRTSDISERYQNAMRFMLDCRGPDALNLLVRNAVLHARLPEAYTSPFPDLLEKDIAGWSLRPAVEAVGQLIVEHPTSLASPILTSNFDPLLEVSIRRSGGQAMSIFLAADGQFQNVIAPGTSQIVHFHGFWRGGDTLHTPAQLTRNRPQLKGGLRNLLRETTLVVMAYGGWSDVFTRTLVDVISEQTEELNVLWTFYSDNVSDIENRNATLLQQFAPLAGQRVLFYTGVDCHVFLPRLREKTKPPEQISVVPVTTIPSTVTQINLTEPSDLPPKAPAWVGRESELRNLLSSSAKVVAITGLGGNGKSSLAAKYLEERLSANEIAHWYWADCREQSNTLHTQLIRMVERVSDGEIRGSQLRDSDTNNVVELLMKLLENQKAVLVFDNIDQYIDLESALPIGTMGVLLERALTANHKSQLLFTGRPRLNVENKDFLQIQLSGLFLPDTKKLFEICGVQTILDSNADLIKELHTLTSGHPLVLTLIAKQVATGAAELSSLVAHLQGGAKSEIIDVTIFSNIWASLNSKQQTVLRYMAELLHPEPEQRIAGYLGNVFNYNQFSKAIRALRALHLVVVKSPGGEEPDTLELHPLVRDFVQNQSKKSDRIAYMDTIIRFFDRMIGKFRPVLSEAPQTILENWTGKVELCINAGRYKEALLALNEVKNPLRNRGYSEEFVRLASRLFELFSPTEEDATEGVYDSLIGELIKVLSEIGQYSHAEVFLKRLEQTIIGKSARYIFLCDVRAYAFWLQGDFEKAKQCAQEGVTLKKSVNLDTKHDCTHTLALIQRDLGEIEPALKIFLNGKELQQVADSDTYDIELGGHFYGNIGRCLQFLGHTQQALRCIQKSALILELSSDFDVHMNQGWASMWLGELLEADANFEAAYVAFMRASLKWRTVSPLRAMSAADKAKSIRDKLENGSELPFDDWEIANSYIAWLRSSSLRPSK